MMVNQRITDLRKAFNIPNHFNPGILGILIYYPYKPKKYYIDALKYFSEIEINQVILFSDNEDIAANYFPNSYPISKSGKTIDELPYGFNDKALTKWTASIGGGIILDQFHSTLQIDLIQHIGTLTFGFYFGKNLIFK